MRTDTPKVPPFTVDAGKSSDLRDAKPAISVIIPVHDDADNLWRCLYELCRSRFTNFEVIVVDDGSSDNIAAKTARDFNARLIRLSRNGGPAQARNRGARAGRADLLLFIDADVSVHRDTIERVVAAFNDASIDALFGAYDTQPSHGNFCSQYKNLSHHFFHSSADADAVTFWTGCGAIRKRVFDRLEGFDERYRRPSIEDVELGVRLKRAGGTIVVDKSVLVTHRKRWTFSSMVKSDVRDRAIPWTILLLRERNLPNKLNLGWTQRFSMLLSYICIGTLFLRPMPLLPIACLLGIIVLNWRYYWFFCRQRGPLFATAVLPLQLFFYTYSGVAMGLGILDYVTAKPLTRQELPLHELVE